MSNKAGPNGPATISAIADLTALKQKGNEKLFDAISVQLKSRISWLNLEGHELLEGNWKHSKLVYLSDKSGKTRIIAIADWWSNAALSNIHKTFMVALRNNRNDLTFRQDFIGKYVNILGQNLYSSDMTAATDRFPIELETAVVAEVFGQDEANRWKTIISDRDFIDSDGKHVRYEVGNPMGVLSSWPVFTATHHVVKLYCAYKMQCKHYRYGLLGDDSMDSEYKFYKYYQKILTELGLQISTSKCTISESGSCEFAKRLFRNHKEVTGLPVDLLKNLSKFPEQMLELIRMCRLRGYSDEILRPRVLDLLQTFPFTERTIIADILSLPEEVTESAPLLEVRPLSYSAKLMALEVSDRLTYLTQARDLVFWQEVQSIKGTAKSKTSVDFTVKPNHPIVFALSNQLDPYLGLDPDYSDVNLNEMVQSEYTIYDAWIQGNYRHMAKLPSLDTYMYYNRGHKVTKCKYKVLKKMLELVNTDNTHLFLNPIRRISDMDLYDIAFEAMQAQFK